METQYRSKFYQHLMDDLQDEALCFKVAYKFGGLRYYIPNKVDKNHQFAELGELFFIWLVDNYGGNALVFPAGPNNAYKHNQLRARTLAKKGLSSNQIASLLGVSYSSACRAKSKVKKELIEQKQINLF